MAAMVVYALTLSWWVACMWLTHRLADGPLPEKTAVEFRIMRMEARLEAMRGNGCVRKVYPR